MLETAIERIKLLKSGILGKEMEKIYLLKNGFKMVEKNLLPEDTTDWVK